MSYAFNAARHIHTYDGKPLHGVTSVLKNWGDPGALVNWAANQAVDAISRGESKEDARKAHLKVRDAAGDKGKEVHAILEKAMNVWIDVGVMQLTEDAVVNSVLNWMSTNGYRPVEAEKGLYSVTMWTGGICDLVAEKDGKKFIMDFKTSGSVQTKFFYQMAAYSLMYKEMSDESIEGCVVIHIPRGASFSVDKNIYTRYDMSELEQAWSSLLKVYLIDKELQKLITY